MSKFASELINSIQPYVPGEQPKDTVYIKLNTNENPYYTCKNAIKRIDKAALERLNRYSDPESCELTKAIADCYGVKIGNVLVTNGSDEALAFAFYAYCKGGVCYADVTYGFYDVIAGLFGCPVEHIALEADFTIDVTKYFNCGKTVVVANPNAQTGIGLGGDKIRELIENNRQNIVIVDQAYADFSQFNAIELTAQYDNLVVVNTFSKSRSLAGARVGYIIADERLIEDIKKVKNSFHPYNVNSLSAALAAEAIRDSEYFDKCVKAIVATRCRLCKELIELGFEVLPSSANFVLARCDAVDGHTLYAELKRKGVLVRHFNDERIRDYVRITVGTDGEIDRLLTAIKEVLAEK